MTIYPWLILLLLGVWYILFYKFYGGYFHKRIAEAKDENITPAHKYFDGIDYVPANKYILYGHHVGAIAGTGPIAGPTMAMAWGWLPGILWIAIANVVLGAVHDYLALIASIRHEGKTIAFVSGQVLSKRTQYIFQWYILFSLILVIAAFVIFDVQVFMSTPSTATAILWFMPIAIFVGVLMYKLNFKLPYAVVTGVVLLLLAMYAGYKLPLVINNFNAWITILLIYGWMAGWLPLWYFLQPRDFLNVYIMWGGIILGAIGLILARIPIQLDALSSFTWKVVGGQPSPVYPTIVLVIACGALSGYHSLVASGTTARQLNSELDAQAIGYGGMLTEGLVAMTVALSVATMIPFAYSYYNNVPLDQVLANKSVLYNYIISSTLPSFIRSYGFVWYKAFDIPLAIGTLFAGLWFATFDFAVLDTTNRLARFTWNEIVEPLRIRAPTAHKILSNRYLGSLVALLIGGSLAYTGALSYVYPAFSGANQLLAALALITTSSYVYYELRRSLKQSLLAFVPAFFLWITVTSALFWYEFKVAIPKLQTGLATGNGTAIYLGASLSTMVAILLILDIILILEFIDVTRKKRKR
ncbi:MAG: carbon starvation protein A [Fervidicoccus fontis]|uniref:Carbon starvation protein A n=1 Tax=Fervidicoccus fontis TaxID=683846 RepID=A0A2J6N2Q4_9CREN|nr:MAG: carbon starvation protein A [Fervidicoccus fontis]